MGPSTCKFLTVFLLYITVIYITSRAPKHFICALFDKSAQIKWTGMVCGAAL